MSLIKPKEEKGFSLEGQGIKDGPLTIRLAQGKEEIRAAQALRYQVFYEEQGAIASEDVRKAKLDFDPYDDIADHLIVLDERNEGFQAQLVGNYRVMRQSVAEKHGKFYTEDEFDISCLKSLDGNLMELGRSCVHPEYRTRPVLQLLWQGLAEYMFHFNIDYFFGCASIPDTDIEAHRQALSYLHHFHLAPPALRPKALDHVYEPMNLMSKEEINEKKAFQSLPPLFKGYLRVGSFVGDGAFIDKQWQSIDVCIVLKTALLADRYLKHYARKGERS
tara:strand:+ start:211 stop:1038 length:828 start_codon:yes stop_codon:yes gene_type:complete